MSEARESAVNDPVEKRIGRYTILREIASGGMATVFLARLDDAGVSRTVAIKRLHPHLSNETEFVQLLKLRRLDAPAPDALAALDDEALHALCRRLHAGTVVVTLGAHGAFVSHAPDSLRGDAQPHYRSAPERVQAVDTTGAGDAFSGALAAALANAPEPPFADAVRSAGRVAALSTERRGAALAIPRQNDVAQRFGV